MHFIVIVVRLWFSPVFSLAYRWDAHRPHGFWCLTKIILDTFTVGWKVDDTCGHIVELCLSSERILQLVLFPPGLFSAGGMALWHGVEYYENEKMVGEREFYRPKVTSVSLLLVSTFTTSPLLVNPEKKRAEFVHLLFKTQIVVSLLVAVHFPL